MDKDRVKGKVKQVTGRVQEAKGSLTNNPNDKMKGEAKQVAGKIQEGLGKAKDAVRKATK